MPPYIWMPPYVWMPLISLDAPPVCLDAPICLDNPLYVWMPPCLNTLLYVWMPHMFESSPVCLGTTMFGCPLNMCGHSHVFQCPYMYGRCLNAYCTYTTQKNMLCQTAGVSICTHTFGCPLCLDVPVCLNTPHMF